MTVIKNKLAITCWLDCLNKDVDRKIEKQVRIPRKVEWYRHLVLLCWLQIRYYISLGLSFFLLFTPPRGVCNSVAWSDGPHCLISKVSYLLKEIFHFIYSTGAVTSILNSKNYPLWCSFYLLSRQLDTVITGGFLPACEGQ